MAKKRRIAVLMGGPSSERKISLRSGKAVVKALELKGHEAVPVDVRTDTGKEVGKLRCDVAFVALHGRFGEDGGIQKILERRGIPYTGSGPKASAAAFDKIETKRRFTFAGVETPAHRVITTGDSQEVLEGYGRTLGYPVVIKPRAEGSSIGITVHEDWGTVVDGAAEAFKYGAIAIMEKRVVGREMTVGILNDKTLPIIEIQPARTFFDYDAKYEDRETGYVLKPKMSHYDRRSIEKMALEAHEALHLEGFSRVDLIFSHLRSVCVLEVNTIPGMTPRSLLPKAALGAGIDFPELCEAIVESAFKRRKRFGLSAAIF
ncbi:MAG: D-alanine--D-alanine ligase [Planctomycetota bacterium]|jgi:D-alanine-D-alanine ligase